MGLFHQTMTEDRLLDKVTFITLERSDAEDVSDLAVTGVLHPLWSGSPSSHFTEKSRTMLFSLSMTTLLTRLVTSARSSYSVLVGRLGTIGILTGLANLGILLY